MTKQEINNRRYIILSPAVSATSDGVGFQVASGLNFFRNYRFDQFVLEAVYMRVYIGDEDTTPVTYQVIPMDWMVMRLDNVNEDFDSVYLPVGKRIDFPIKNYGTSVSMLQPLAASSASEHTS